MNPTPKWFKFVAALALLWNLLGCLAFASDLGLSADDIAKLPEAQQMLYRARPVWALFATGLAVIGGALGCLAALFGKKAAHPLFIASLIGLVAQDFGLFVLVDGARLAGPVVMVLQGLVFAIAVGLVLFARTGIARGWLR